MCPLYELGILPDTRGRRPAVAFFVTSRLYISVTLDSINLHSHSRRVYGRPPLPLILVVEDDTEVLEIVVEFLRSLGHEVLAATSGEQARGFLGTRSVELVVTDCLMSGEPGLSLAQFSAGLGIPVILTTGDPHHLDTLASSPLPVLPKPFRLGDLQQLVARSLKLSTA